MIFPRSSRSHGRAFSLAAVVAVTAVVTPACHDAQLSSAGGAQGGARGGGSGGAGGGAGAGPSDAGGTPLFDVANGDDTPASAMPPGGTCAEDIKMAKQVPLALLLVIDASESMGSSDAAGGPTRYQQVAQAIDQFVKAPGSAGLTLGLQFFPQPGGSSACENDGDCGYMFIAPTPPSCQPTSVCANTIAGDGVPKSCGGPRNIACAAGDTCVPLGRCSKSFLDCANLGQPCAGGVPDDACLAVGKTCEVTDDQRCDVQAYQTLPVPFVDLPGGASAMTRAIGRRGPTGGTPMRPAVEGALATFRAHLGQHPDRHGVIVIATDGAPFGCERNTVADVATLLTAARAAMTSLPTYVVGVATSDPKDRAGLEAFATAGGTGVPFVISPAEPLAQRFLDTLNQIRGQALPCEFSIPMPATGTTIDFLKVNVRWKLGSSEEEVLYAAAADHCDATRGGWYYDVDPAKAHPTRIIACPATCAKLKAKPEATVDIKFGCQTRTID